MPESNIGRLTGALERRFAGSGACRPSPAILRAVKPDSVVRQQLRSAQEIEQALDRNAPVRFLLCLEDSADEATQRVVARAQTKGIPVRRVAERELRRLVPHGFDTEILALIGPPPAATLEDAMQQPGVIWLLVGCTYPGNVGYAIRSAEVSGAAAIVIASEFDRTERRDCLRYGMRVDRFFPVLFADAKEVFTLAKDSGRVSIALEDVGEQSPWEVDMRGPLLMIVGGEEAGVPDEVLAQADHVVRVPMHGFLPSYNLQAAMAIVMGERLRQTSSG